ncbi:S13A1 protein, partial [Polyodon spathula]|nr:S13A1 protein [Polyodon spathula]
MPLAVTALIPALMFPLFGIMKSKMVASSYFKDFHLLLIGVVCLATSIEKWNLHKRIALRMVMLVGVNPGWLMLGFMVSSAFLSMWLSNTSTAAMVMPIVEAVIQQILNAEAEVNAIQMNNMEGTSNLGLQLDEIEGKYISKKDHMMCKGMSLCIAYSCTIGGLSTITGTSTNLIFAEHFNNRYPDCQCINFGTWFVLTFPITIIILILSWVWLHWLYLGFEDHAAIKVLVWYESRFVLSELPYAFVDSDVWMSCTGACSFYQIYTRYLFLQTFFVCLMHRPAFSGMFRCAKDKSEKEKASSKIINNEYKKLGPVRYKGYATDATAALILGLLFFIIPANMPTNSSFGKKNDLSYTTLITWKEFQSCMPWEIALLVGGGFALAQGTEDSGLSAWVGSKLTPLGSFPIWVTIVVSSLIVTSVTEVASNPATITIFLPILSPLAEAISINPLYILIPTTLCTSFAFLLPGANPPNAIVFTYGHLQVIDMVKAGLGVNIIGVLAVMLGVRAWGVPLFDLETYPSWAPPDFSANMTGP